MGGAWRVMQKGWAWRVMQKERASNGEQKWKLAAMKRQGLKSREAIRNIQAGESRSTGRDEQRKK